MFFDNLIHNTPTRPKKVMASLSSVVEIYWTEYLYAILDIDAYTIDHPLIIAKDKFGKEYEYRNYFRLAELGFGDLARYNRNPQYSHVPDGKRDLVVQYLKDAPIDSGDWKPI